MAKSWLRELRRQHVLRVAAAGVASGELPIQVAVWLFPFLHDAARLNLLALAGSLDALAPAGTPDEQERA